MAVYVLLAIALAVVVLAVLGYVGWLIALPALGLLVAVLLGYMMRTRGPS